MNVIIKICQIIPPPQRDVMLPTQLTSGNLYCKEMHKFKNYTA